MMCRYFFHGSWMLVTLHLVASIPYPTFPKCDKQVIKNIQKFSRSARTYPNFLELLEGNGYYFAVFSSYNFMNQDSKCIIMNTTSSLITFAFPSKNCCPTGYLHFPASGVGDIVATTDNRIHWYNVFYGNEVLAFYGCNFIGGIQGPPLLAVFVSQRSYYNNNTQTTIRSAAGLLDLLTTEYVYQYGEECLSFT